MWNMLGLVQWRPPGMVEVVFSTVEAPRFGSGHVQYSGGSNVW